MNSDLECEVVCKLALGRAPGAILYDGLVLRGFSTDQILLYLQTYHANNAEFPVLIIYELITIARSMINRIRGEDFLGIEQDIQEFRDHLADVNKGGRSQN